MTDDEINDDADEDDFDDTHGEVLGSSFRATPSPQGIVSRYMFLDKVINTRFYYTKKQDLRPV